MNESDIRKYANLMSELGLTGLEVTENDRVVRPPVIAPGGMERLGMPIPGDKPTPPTGSVVTELSNPAMSGRARVMASRTAGSDSEARWLSAVSHTSVIQMASASAGSRATM